jgi:hypothetical protein
MIDMPVHVEASCGWASDSLSRRAHEGEGRLLRRRIISRGWPAPLQVSRGEPQDPPARRFRRASASGMFRGEATFTKLLSAPSGPLRGFGGGLIAVLEG